MGGHSETEKLWDAHTIGIVRKIDLIKNMVYFISYIPVISPLLKKPHVCIILSLVGQIDHLYRRVVHILIAKGVSSGQNEEIRFQCMCILLNK